MPPDPAVIATRSPSSRTVSGAVLPCMPISPVFGAILGGAGRGASGEAAGVCQACIPACPRRVLALAATTTCWRPG